MSDGRYLF